jgi:hypothetical protein
MKTDLKAIRRFLTETHACAMQMMENAAFIQQELPLHGMPDSLRARIETLCEQLVGTKHDLIHEVFEIDDLMPSAPDAAVIHERLERIRQWISETTMTFHNCVLSVEESVDKGEVDASVSLLLTESGYNILTTVPAAHECAAEMEIEPGPEEDEDDEGSEAEDTDPNCYAFYAEDSYPVGQLVGAIRRVMKRPELSTEDIAQLHVFLFAMERLPLVTPGVRMSLGLRLDQGGESDWIEIRMEDGTFTLGRGTWIGGDADTETDFEVSTDYRDGDAFQASNFAQSFRSRAEDVCREVVIEDTSDEPFTGWHLEKDKSRWGSLPCSFL